MGQTERRSLYCCNQKEIFPFFPNKGYGRSNFFRYVIKFYLEFPNYIKGRQMGFAEKKLIGFYMLIGIFFFFKL